MRVSGIQIIEGSKIINPVIPSGSSFPTQPDIGELFFLTGAGLHAYNGASWSIANNLVTYANLAAFPAIATATPGILYIALDTGIIYVKKNSGDSVYSPVHGFADWGNIQGTLANQTDLNNVLVANKTIAETASTSLFSGGAISINADTTKINIAAGVALFMDYTTPTSPVGTVVNFGPINAVSITNIASQPVTYFGINAASTLIQQAGPFTATQRRTIVPLGIAVHSNNIVVNAVNQLGSPNQSLLNQYQDLVNAIGPLNISGNIYTFNGGNLNVNKSAGVIFKYGSNFQNSVTDPHQTSIGSQTALTFRYRRQNSIEGGDTTSIDPTKWDNAGTLSNVSNNQWTIQRIYLFQSGLTRVQYGQAVYSQMNDAINSMGTEPFIVESNIAANGLFRGYLIVKGNATNLSDNTQAAFYDVAKFGSIVSAATAVTSASITSALGYTPQAQNANLTAISGLTTSTDTIDYWTGSGTAALATLTSYGRSLIDDADASTSRATLGLGTMAVQNSSAVAITGGTVNGTSIGATSRSTINATDIDTNGNLTLSGSGKRVIGDFSNATAANRLLFQTTTTNAFTSVGIIPNGTSTSAGIAGYNNPTPTNSAYFNLAVDGTQVSLTADKLGTGSYQPISFFTSGLNQLQITTAGNLLFNQTGQRILGDFSNATVSSRVYFQTTTTNGITQVSALPNGTSTSSAFYAFSNSDPTNSSFGLFGADQTATYISAQRMGTGTFLPISFQTSGAERARIATTGNVLINTSTDDTVHKLLVNGVTKSTAYAEVIDARGSISGAQTLTINLGSYKTATIVGATTFTFAVGYALPATTVIGFTLRLINGGSATLTWPGTLTWVGGAPTFQASGTDFVSFWTEDGTNYYGKKM